MRLGTVAIAAPCAVVTAAIAVVRPHRGRRGGRRPDLGLVLNVGIEVDQQVRVVRLDVAPFVHLDRDGFQHVLRKQAFVAVVVGTRVFDEIPRAIGREVGAPVVVGTQVAARRTPGHAGQCQGDGGQTDDAVLQKCHGAASWINADTCRGWYYLQVTPPIQNATGWGPAAPWPHYSSNGRILFIRPLDEPFAAPRSLSRQGPTTYGNFAALPLSWQALPRDSGRT